MKTALGISLAGHAVLVVLSSMSLLPAPVQLEADVVDSVDVEMISIERFVALTTPVPEPTPAPQEPDLPDLQTFSAPASNSSQSVTNQLEPPAVNPEKTRPLQPPEPLELPEITTSIPPENPAIPEQTPQFTFSSPTVPVPDPAERHVLPSADALQLPDSDRVAKDISPKPLPEVQIADEDRQLASPAIDPGAEFVLPPERETARKESSIAVVTEAIRAETPSFPGEMQPPDIKLPERATLVAPVWRPSSVEVAKAEPEKPAPDIAATIARLEEENKSADLVASAKEFSPRNGLNSSLSRLKRTINEAWNVGVLSTEAEQVTLEVQVEMVPQGLPGSITLLSSDGGSPSAVQAAFEAARRAVLQGIGQGHELPIDLYDRWRVLIITFDRKS